MIRKCRKTLGFLSLELRKCRKICGSLCLELEKCRKIRGSLSLDLSTCCKIHVSLALEPEKCRRIRGSLSLELQNCLPFHITHYSNCSSQISKKLEPWKKVAPAVQVIVWEFVFRLWAARGLSGSFEAVIRYQKLQQSRIPARCCCLDV